MNVQQLNISKIPATMPHGLQYSDEMHDFAEYRMSEEVEDEDYAWEEFESGDILSECNDNQFISSNY